MNFTERRDSILKTFSSAKTDLENLNAEIQAAVDSNTDNISALRKENEDLMKLKNSNVNAIAVFSKIFK